LGIGVDSDFGRSRRRLSALQFVRRRTMHRSMLEASTRGWSTARRLVPPTRPSAGERQTSEPRLFRVLVVDDNEGVHEDFRRVFASAANDATELDGLAAALFGAGSSTAKPPSRYETQHAMQGFEGVDLTRSALQDGLPFDVAFVDMRMPPGLNGVQTTAQLWKLDPQLQVVLCTAYSDFRWSEVMNVLGNTANLHLLRKPFSAAQARQVAEVLAVKAKRLRNTG
jgi:CheY-like chemotaxis protein